jgi:hypothetical protein
MSSMPTDKRTRSTVTPAASCSSRDICWWVVDEGESQTASPRSPGD